MANITPRPVPQAKPRPLTEEEKKQKIMQFLQQKREQFSLTILNGLCQGALDDLIKSSDAPSAVVKMSVRMADILLEKLYPIKEDESTDK